MPLHFLLHSNMSATTKRAKSVSLSMGHLIEPRSFTTFYNVIALLKADSRNVYQIVSKKGTCQNRLIAMISNDIIGQTIALLSFNVLVWPVFLGHLLGEPKKWKA